MKATFFQVSFISTSLSKDFSGIMMGSLGVADASDIFSGWTFTPLKTNMSTENQWLEDVFPTEIISPFLGDMLVVRGVYQFDFARFCNVKCQHVPFFGGRNLVGCWVTSVVKFYTLKGFD